MDKVISWLIKTIGFSLIFLLIDLLIDFFSEFVVPVVLGICALLAIYITGTLISDNLSIGSLAIGILLGFIVFVLSFKKITNKNLHNVSDDRTKPWDYIRRVLIVLSAALPAEGYELLITLFICVLGTTAKLIWMVHKTDLKRRDYERPTIDDIDISNIPVTGDYYTPTKDYGRCIHDYQGNLNTCMYCSRRHTNGCYGYFS